jgi:tetratricopeptide (TPR) repeat protein
LILKVNIHINKFLLILTVIIAGINISLFSQTDSDQSLLIEIEAGVKLMDEGNYIEADRKFKRALRNLEVLPAEISFYFGKNSYFLDQYKQSINWLNKYIELKGTKGRFFEECVEYLNRAEMAYKLESEKNSGMVISELTKSNEFDCKGKTHFKCPICLGEGVLLKPGKMNDVLYQTCPYCAGSGFITCDQYKLYLRGELKPIN